MNRSRPVHLSWTSIGLVAVGGGLGTGLRYLITMLTPKVAGLPIATFGINVIGAFLLGVLLELLADRSLDTGWSRRIRLGVGTGWSRRIRLGVGTGGLGGFTTYSALATETVVLAASHIERAIGYAAGTVIIGGVASIAGIWLSRRHLRPPMINGKTEP